MNLPAIPFPLQELPFLLKEDNANLEKDVICK
jgi:hypothetical protein